MVRIRPFLLLTALGACGATAPAEPNARTSILFVGNSLTYVNDLPATMRAIAASTGDTLHIESVTGGGLALIDHLTGSTNAAQVIRGSHWTYVVLQQGPTTVGLCRDSLLLWTSMFDTIIRGSGGTPALFMVWPSGGAPEGFDAVHTSFALAAQRVHGVFLPAGDAWRQAWLLDPTLQLYGADHFHPGPVGSFLAALVIYERLTGRDARTLPAVAFNAGQPMSLSSTTIQLLQSAAHAANAAAAAAAPLPPDPSHAGEVLPGGHC